MATKTIIVTGAASGIGYACARSLLEEGHNVTAADIAPVPAAMADGVPAGRLLPLRIDVTALDECLHAVAETVTTYGRVDALIHMAAIHATETWRDLEADRFNRVLAVNVTGSFLMARAVGEHMVERGGGGAIVLASSGSINSSGVGGDGRGGAAYVSSKAAIVGLTRALARSLGPHRIRVNAVSPGSTDTPMTAGYTEAAKRNVAARTLLGRIGEPEDIAAVARFLISDGAGYITGEIVNVSGGGSFG